LTSRHPAHRDRDLEKSSRGVYVTGVRRRCDKPPDGAALCRLESTFAYFEALKAYLGRHGKPVAFYSDKHSIFRVSNENASAAME
jgi:hypothetical protein